jgi:pyrroline-5-carboxylate reductase
MTVAKDIIIIGAGHMGYAIAAGLRRSSPTLSIAAVDLDHTYDKEMNSAGIQVINNLPNHSTSKIMILAIPPQAFAAFAESNLQQKLRTAMTVSVMAGVNLCELADHLKTLQICRAIPNLPSAINEGMSVLAYTPQSTQKNRCLVNGLFSKLGRSLIVQDESLVDHATALIGGGPAYVAYFAQALIDYALLAGFDERNACAMVVQILRGSSALLDTNQETPKKLCEKVMTQNGTTEQAIKLFNNKKMKTIIVDGLKHAYTRSKELGRRF